MVKSYSQNAFEASEKKFYHMDTISDLNISELILFDDNIFINIGVKKVEGRNDVWYTYGRYIVMQNSIYCRSYLTAMSDITIQGIQEKFTSRSKSLFHDIIEPFKLIKHIDYKFEIENGHLLDEDKRVYYPSKGKL